MIRNNRQCSLSLTLIDLSARSALDPRAIEFGAEAPGQGEVARLAAGQVEDQVVDDHDEDHAQVGFLDEPWLLAIRLIGLSRLGTIWRLSVR